MSRNEDEDVDKRGRAKKNIQAMTTIEPFSTPCDKGK
jgi:hypothetical protein